MLLRKTAVFATIIGSMAWSPAALAQTAVNSGSPCRVDPGTPQEDGSLTETLDDCNGVLKPQVAGDPGIIVEAPDVGETPVIEPGELPKQPSHDAPDSQSTSEFDDAAGYSAGRIVDAIAKAEEMADAIRSWDATEIDVHDISLLVEGVDAAVINASLSVHARAIELLQVAVAENHRIVEALQARGLKPAGVVAVEIDGSGNLTVFSR